MSTATTAPQALRILWKEGIFLEAKDVRAVEAELARRGYNFGDKNLMMALKGRSSSRGRETRVATLTSRNTLLSRRHHVAAESDLRRQLADHERRLRILEARAPKMATPNPQLKRRSLPQHILSLRDSGFFAQPKIAQDVQKKLLPTYHCELDRVTMALYRLGSRKELRKASKTVDGKRFQAYVW